MTALISGGILSHSSLQILSKSLRFCKWHLATRTFSSLYIFSMGLRSGGLARPLQDLNVLLLEPLICCLSHVFWVIVILEYPSTTHFQYPGWLQCPGTEGTWPHPSSFWLWCSCPVSLAENTPQSITFPPPCLTVEMLFLGSFLLQTWRVELMPKSLILV